MLFTFILRFIYIFICCPLYSNITAYKWSQTLNKSGHNVLNPRLTEKSCGSKMLLWTEIHFSSSVLCATRIEGVKAEAQIGKFQILKPTLISPKVNQPWIFSCLKFPVVIDCPLMVFLQGLLDFAFLCFIRNGKLSDLRESLSGEAQWEKISLYSLERILEVTLFFNSLSEQEWCRF